MSLRTKRQLESCLETDSIDAFWDEEKELSPLEQRNQEKAAGLLAFCEYCGYEFYRSSLHLHEHHLECRGCEENRIY